MRRGKDVTNAERYLAMSEDIMRESDELTEEIIDIAAERKMHWRSLFLSGHRIDQYFARS